MNHGDVLDMVSAFTCDTGEGELAFTRLGSCRACVRACLLVWSWMDPERGAAAGRRC